MYGIVLDAADYTFLLDGQIVGAFTSTALDEPSYHMLLYSNPSISSGTHTFVMQNGGSLNIQTLALLDYAVYTM